VVRRDKPKPQPSFKPVLVWGLLSVLMASTGAAIGYLVPGPAAVASARPPVPRLLQVDDIFAAGLAEGRQGARRARVRERRAGYRAGLSEGRRLASGAFAERYRRGGPAHRRILVEGERRALERFRFGAEGFYIVGVVDGGRRVDASHGPLSRSEAYEVCHDGRAICRQDAGS